MATFTSRIILKGQDKTAGAFGSVKRNIGGVKTAIASLTGLLATGGFIVAGKQAIDAADKIGKLSTRIGASTEALSQYEHVAERSGVTFQTLTTGFQRMTRRIAEAAATGKGEAVPALQALGLAAKDLASLAPEQQFELIADAMQGVSTQGEKVRLAMKLFDTEGVALLQTMEGGAAAIREMRMEADALGKTLTDEQVDAATKAKDAMAKFKASVEGATNTLILHFAPVLQSIAEWLTIQLPLALKAAQAAFLIFKKTVIDIVGAVSFALEDFFKVYGFLGEGFREAGRKVSEVTQAMAEESRSLARELEQVITETAELNLKLNDLVPDAGEAADSIAEISTTSIAAKKDTENLALAMEFLGEQTISVNLMASERVEAMKALMKIDRELTEVLDEETAALRRQEEQARATAAAFNQLFSAVGSLNQTFGLGLNATQGAGVAQALQNLGISPGMLGAFAGGAQGAGSLAGGLLGGLGAVLGTPGGPIGQAIGAFIGQTVGDFLDSIFGGGGLQNSEIVFGAQGRGQGGSPLIFPGLGGQQTLIRGGGSEFRDQFQGPAAQAVQGFFGLLEDVLTGPQLEAAIQALEGQTFVIRPEDVEGGRFLEPILDTIISAMDPVVQRFVNQFEGIENRLEAFAAINLTLQVLEADPIQMWADALADADRTAVEVLRDMSNEVGTLGRTAFDSADDMIAWGASVEAFNRQFIAFMAGIEQARRNIAGSTESTIQGLRFSALEGNPAAQFAFLTRRANQLGAGIGGLGSAEEIERTIAQIQQLLTQAFSIATPEQRALLLPQFEATLRSAEAEAQERLNELQEEAEAIAEERREQINSLLEAMGETNARVDNASNVIGISGDRIRDAADKIETGGNLIIQGANVLVSTPLQVTVASFEVTG